MTKAIFSFRYVATLALCLIVSVLLANCSDKRNRKIFGWASVNEQRVSFTSGLSWWDSTKRRLTIAVLPYSPGSDEKQKIRKHDSVSLGGRKPTEYIELNLVFKAGATIADITTLERYYINFGGYTGGPVSLNRQHFDWTYDGGILELSGRLDSQVRGHFKRGDYSLNGQKHYQWDLSFDVSLIEAQP